MIQKHAIREKEKIKNDQIIEKWDDKWNMRYSTKKAQKQSMTEATELKQLFFKTYKLKFK